MAQEVKGKKKNRLWYMILSVIIAILAWVLVTYTTDPDITKTIIASRIDLVGEDVLLKNGYVVTNYSEFPRLTIKMRGKRSDLMKALDNAVVTVDVSQITKEGEFEIETSAKLPTSRINVERISQSVIPITVESIKTKEIPVRIVQEGELPGMLVKSEPESKTVTLKGAVAELDMIDAVEAIVDISTMEQSGTIDTSYTLILKDDAERDELSTVNMSENIITISNTLYQEKEVPIKVESTYTNEYVLSDKDTKTEPKTVKVGVLDGTELEFVTVSIDENAEGGEYKLNKSDGVYIPEDRKNVIVKPVWEKR
jgi:YbbR domain-containing protein